METPGSGNSLTPQGNLPPVVLMAASAGGIPAINVIISMLPADFPAAVVVLQHRSPPGPSVLSKILAAQTRLPVSDATAGDRVEAGRLYLAKPDQHLTFTHEGTFQYVNGTRIRHLLSSANPLFESAAWAFGSKAVAVVLTGSGLDATDGVQSIKAHGGIVIVQDPADASHASMPSSAIRTGAADFILPLDVIAPTLMRLLKRESGNVASDVGTPG